MDEKKKEQRFSVDLPAELYEAVERDAAKEKRSKAKQVEWIIEKHYQSTPATVESLEKISA